MKEFVESSVRSAAIAPTALFLSEKRLLNKKAIKYRREYVKDFLYTGSANIGDVYPLSALTNSTTSDLIDSICVQHDYRSYRKNVFWPPAFFGGIGASFKILEIL